MRITSIILLFIAGINALAAGYAFIADPSGNSVGLTTDYLRFSPFDNYFIPGIVLFVAIGIFCIVTGVMAIKKGKYYPFLIGIQGCLLTGWIIIQVILVRDFNWLHFIILIIGLLLMIFGKKMRGQLIIES